MTTRELRIIGITNEQTECDRCGRMELRGTVIIGGDEGEVGRYGTTCASRILGVKVTRQDAVNAEAHRRYMVLSELRDAKKASDRGDMAAMQMYLDGARKIGLIHPDEIKFVAQLEG